MPADDADRILLAAIRRGSGPAWEQLISRFEGRLLAYVRRRLSDKTTAEDVVQETFLGFLTSLPNYDDSTPLENYLFSIAAHKLTNVLRSEGSRPALPLTISAEGEEDDLEPAGPTRRASSLMQSRERRTTEEAVIAECLRELIQQWRETGEWERLQCLELLWVSGWPNKTVAARLGITEQAVANHRHYVQNRLKALISQRLGTAKDWDEVF